MKRLIRIFSLAIAIMSITNLHAQTLFTFGKKSVTKSEFLRAFNKNNTDTVVNYKSYREYLDLYTKFKMKVQAALDTKLDTLPGQVAELSNFRAQVANSYMNDEASNQILVEEAFTRSAKDILTAHIFIPNDPSGEDQTKPLATINQVYDLLQKGGDFTKLALEYSKDPSVSDNKGVIGYITCFVLPYDLETVVYTTPIGKYSKPYKSNIGYHIFKNIGERKAVGRMRAAQILLSFPPEATDLQKQSIAKKAASIYSELQKGADFKTLAQANSTDNLSYQNGGELQEFGTGHYDPEFEKHVFAIKTDGDIAAPFETKFGYHIVKRLELKPVNLDKNNKTVWDAMKQQVAQNDRIEVSKAALLKKVIQQTAVKRIPVNQTALNRLADSLLVDKRPIFTGGIKSNTALLSFPKKTLRVDDWIKYLEAIKGSAIAITKKSNTELFNRFVETSAMEYYKDHLEEYNKEFAYQLNEFKEGNLLFEIMQRKIWDAASTDSLGLKKYYDAHKGNYWWEASADAWIFTASNDSIAQQTISKLKAAGTGFEFRKLIDESNGSLQGDSGRFELAQIPVVDRTAFSAGLITAPVKNEADNSASFCYILKLYENREPRAFNDAKGFVINDYQSFLEEEWIKTLRKKYPISIDEGVFNSLVPQKKR